MTLKALDRQKISTTNSDYAEKPLSREQALSDFLGCPITQSTINSLESGTSKLQTSTDDHGIQTTTITQTDTQNFPYNWVAYLAARGLRNVEIAELTGYSPVSVSRIMSTPWVQELAYSLQDRFFQSLEDSKKLATSTVAANLRSAIETAVSLMESEDPKIALRAAQIIMESGGMFNRYKKPEDRDESSELTQIIIDKLLITGDTTKKEIKDGPESHRLDDSDAANVEEGPRALGRNIPKD